MSTVKVVGYDKVTVTHADATAIITIDSDSGTEPVELIMWPRESKALRKALKVAERLVEDAQDAIHGTNREDSLT